MSAVAPLFQAEEENGGSRYWHEPCEDRGAHKLQ